jgi:peptidoglycan/LPS O-acetylase OafA/YrhL
MDSRPERFADHLFAYIFYAPEFPIFQYKFDIPFGQTWSLGIEEKFYLVWPFLAFWLLARSRYRMAMTVVLIAISALLTATSGWLAQMWGSYTDILIGCLVAQLLQQRAIYSRLSVLGETQVAWVAVLALGIGLLGNWTGNQIGECMFSVLAAVTLIALVMNERGPATILGQAWLVRLGVWSYAIYLTHGMVFDFVKPLVPAGRVGDVMTLLAMLIIDLPLCWLLHTYFEKPMIRIGKRLAARMPAVTRPAPAPGNVLEARDSSG